MRRHGLFHPQAQHHIRVTALPRIVFAPTFRTARMLRIETHRNAQPMLHPDDHLTADPNVLFTQLGDDEGVLLHLDTQYYYSLNETGLLIWQGVTKGMSLGQVAKALRAEYEIDADGAWQQVNDFVTLLKEKKLLVDPAATDKK